MLLRSFGMPVQSTQDVPEFPELLLHHAFGALCGCTEAAAQNKHCHVDNRDNQANQQVYAAVFLLQCVISCTWLLSSDHTGCHRTQPARVTQEQWDRLHFQLLQEAGKMIHILSANTEPECHSKAQKLQ